MLVSRWMFDSAFDLPPSPGFGSLKSPPGPQAVSESVLAQAITRDAQYLDAFFYAGIVKDLIGKPADAVPFFDRILNNLPKESEDRRDVVQYTRGVAWYHQYSHTKLGQAEKNFLGIIERSKDGDLRLLARAGLAQTYAMWMIPRTSGKEKLRKGEGADELKFIETKRGQCLKQIDLVLTARHAVTHVTDSIPALRVELTNPKVHVVRKLRSAFVLLVAIVLGLSFAVLQEDVPETAFDESEGLPYESTPLFSILVPQAASEAQAVLSVTRFVPGTPSAIAFTRTIARDASRSPDGCGALALFCTLRC